MFEFFVPGRPATSGSKSGYMDKKTGVIRMSPAGKYQKPWQEAVKWAFMDKYERACLITGPVFLDVIFYLKRPQGHYRTKQGKISDVLKDTAPNLHSKKPDSGKLRRAVEDALTGLAWKDDSQIAIGHDMKLYGEKTGAMITIEERTDKWLKQRK